MAHTFIGQGTAARIVSVFFRGAFPALRPACVTAQAGLFLFRGDVGVHGTNGRFFWLFKPLNSAQQSCEVA